MPAAGGAKHVPIRTCIACRSSAEKRDLVRIVRSPAGVVVYDPTGKAAGRGAYLCAREECVATAVRKRAIERQLKATPSPELIDEISQAIAARPTAARPSP